MKQYMIDFWRIKEYIAGASNYYQVRISEEMLQFYYDDYCQRKWMRANHAARDFHNTLKFQLDVQRKLLGVPLRVFPIPRGILGCPPPPD